MAELGVGRYGEAPEVGASGDAYTTTVPAEDDAVLDYTFDWSDWLSDGDTIQSGTIEVDGVTLDDVANDDTAVTVWLSGGTNDTTATAMCRVTTTGGRTNDRTLRLLIMER